MLEVILRRFEDPDEVRQFEKGRFEIVTIGGMTIGRATYQPGWRWSEHASPDGSPFCGVEHIGLVLSGRATAAMKDGEVHELAAGTIFYVPPEPHDSWVLGDEVYVSLHFLGADKYTTKSEPEGLRDRSRPFRSWSPQTEIVLEAHAIRDPLAV